MASLRPDHPLYLFVRHHVAEVFATEVGPLDAAPVPDYLTGLMLEFLRTDQVFSIKDEDGRPLESVIEMLSHGDVRLHADSFEAERKVHKHIGDFILFWTGLAPKAMSSYRLSNGQDIRCDYIRQGKESYHVVSTFDHSPYEDVAPLFRSMSNEFEALVFVMQVVNKRTGLYPD